MLYLLFVQLCRLITLFCACAAALTLISGMLGATTAPQQAAAAAIAMALAVIPYVFTRSIEGFPVRDGKWWGADKRE